MALVDSVDKIVTTYINGVAKDPFSYKGAMYGGKSITVSPLILRGYTCPPMCGGCCPRFSLDYIPSEQQPYALPSRSVIVNGKTAQMYSDMQTDHKDHFCRNLDKQTGRCMIHAAPDSQGHTGQPFSCDFELIRFLHGEDKVTIMSRLFGRGWAFLRVDGERGARCDMLPETPEHKAEVRRKFLRLAEWCEYFNVEHYVDDIVAWIDQPYHNEPLRIAPR